MSIKRYGTGGRGAGGQPLPFARAVEAAYREAWRAWCGLRARQGAVQA